MTDLRPDLVTPAFRALSARLGQDPLQVQGPGGNTSVKDGGVMWIKASGTELAQAEEADIFVPVDRAAAVRQARREEGDGSCKDTVLDPAIDLRPSIETTFHAAMDHAVVVHTHSIATLTHATSPRGRAVLDEKLAGLPFVRAPYAKPGLPLTDAIFARLAPETQIVVLENHGVIVGGASVEAVSDLLAEVEARLKMPVIADTSKSARGEAPGGFSWAEESWMAQNTRASALALGGSYYPDHVVFLGPALPARDHDGNPPAILVEGQGVLIRESATSSQKAMLRCLSDLLSRVPLDWTPEAIGKDAEAELLNWDAEKYRQALAARA